MLQRHNLATLLGQVAARLFPEAAPMSQLLSLLAELDRVCGQLAVAIDGSQMQLYAMLTLVVVAAFFAFPPKDDPDQI